MCSWISPLKDGQRADKHYDSHCLDYSIDTNTFPQVLITWNATAQSPTWWKMTRHKCNSCGYLQTAAAFLLKSECPEGSCSHKRTIDLDGVWSPQSCKPVCQLWSFPVFHHWSWTRHSCQQAGWPCRSRLESPCCPLILDQWDWSAVKCLWEDLEEILEWLNKEKREETVSKMLLFDK